MVKNVLTQLPVHILLLVLYFILFVGSLYFMIMLSSKLLIFCLVWCWEGGG